MERGWKQQNVIFDDDVVRAVVLATGKMIHRILVSPTSDLDLGSCQRCLTTQQPTAQHSRAWKGVGWSGVDSIDPAIGLASLGR